MKVYIPADATEALDMNVTLADLLDGIRLSELEALDDILEPEVMSAMLEGQVDIGVIRPVLWVRLKREYPDLELAGFDVELVEGEEDTPGKG